MQKRLDVYLTIDLECRRGLGNYYVPIYGKVSNEEKSFGLDFILDTLDSFKLKATFFVEPFFSYRFGLEVLKDVCTKIMRRKQDIQLHMHPYFKSNQKEIFRDRLYTYSYQEQVALIQEAKGILQGCGVHNIMAFRAGSFAANNTTYSALKTTGIRISSNYNLDYLSRTCKIDLPATYNDAFYYDDAILELPITCFCEGSLFGLKKKFRHMQITTVSFSEMKYVIENASRFNIENIVILLHTFEFINEYNGMVKPIHKNIERFLKLCEFLSGKRGAIDVKTISEINLEDAHYRHTKEKAGIPSMPARLSFLRKIEQVKKRIKGLSR